MISSTKQPTVPVTGPLTDKQLDVSELVNVAKAILVELRVISELLNTGLNTREDLDDLREDIEEDSDIDQDYD